MKIVIYGAGSIGCYVGAVWRISGLDVSFLGRASIKQEIEANGLTTTDGEGRRVELRPDEIRFSTHPKLLGDADLVALCAKSDATDGAAKDIARHARPDARVLSFQNGVSNVDRLQAALPGREVLRGMAFFNVIRKGNGRWQKATAGGLWAEDTATTQVLARQVAHGPEKLQLSTDMIGVQWGKLLVNLNNAVNALSGKTMLEQLSERNYRRVVAASQVEALEILESAGIKPAQIGSIPPKLLPHALAAPDLLFRSTVLKAQKIDPVARTSMADDLRLGRRTEIDFLNGEVVKLARSLGRSAPVNERIIELIRIAEQGVERPWSADDLHAYVLHGRAKPGFGY